MQSNGTSPVRLLHGTHLEGEVVTDDSPRDEPDRDEFSMEFG